MLKVADLTLREPLVYVGDGSAAATEEEPAALDLRLPVARQRYEPAQRELSYWPRYDQFTPGQRRIYLEWLAAGRVTVPPELGYTFLFIYSLERRALLEQVDQKVVFDEVVRLRELYESAAAPPSRSFDSYTASFLWHLVVRFPQIIQLKRVQPLMQATRAWTEENLACALSWFAANSLPLPEWAAYLVARQLPRSQRSVVIHRVGDELEELFKKRFLERFPFGVQLHVAQRDRRFSYRPASAALSTMEVGALNPMGIASQLDPLSDLWNECVQELRKLSSVVRKEGQETVSVAAWEALPDELRAGVDHPYTDAFCSLVNTRTDDSGRAVIKASEAAGVLGLAGLAKLTTAQGRKVCEAIGHIGYCLEPDARLTRKGYGPNELLAVFLRTSEQEADPKRYGAAASMLRFGLAVAAADGIVHEDETSVLLQQIQQLVELNDEERRRLEALRSLIVANESEAPQLGRLAKHLSVPQRQAVGKLLLALIAADGVVTPDELRSVRSCYSKLGFDKPEIDAALSSLQPAATEDDEVVTVQAGEASQAGEVIPPAPRAKQPAGLKLDRAAIAAIMQDTRAVAEMLASAMASEDDEDSGTSESELPSTQTPTPATSEPAVGADITRLTVVTTSHPTLPARYAAFYQILISREWWQLEDAEAAARQHGHMLSGAIEVLNEWAFEKYGGQLFVEDGERLAVEKQYLS